MHRLFMTVVAAALIWPISNFAIAREVGRVPPLSLPAIKANLIIAAGARAEPRFGEILGDYLAQEEESGLIIIGAAEQHEIESARKFSSAMKAKLGLRVVLLSTWGASSVPAFDGVVINAENKIVANFSMKKVASPHVERLATATKTAFSKIRRFSTIESWLDVMLNQVSVHPDSLTIRDLNEHQKYILNRSYNEVSDEVSIFKIGSDRPNWVFIDNSSPLKFTEQDADEFREEITGVIGGDVNKSVVLHSNGRFFTFKGGLSCEATLNPPKQ